MKEKNMKPRRKTDLAGKELLQAVREILDVRATPQGRAPEALPLLAGEGGGE